MRQLSKFILIFLNLKGFFLNNYQKSKIPEYIVYDGCHLKAFFESRSDISQRAHHSSLTFRIIIAEPLDASAESNVIQIFKINV